MLRDRFELEYEIGSGGMGTVFKGMDTQSGQPVAIKRLKADLINSAMLERFRREGEALHQLNHPNIVKFVDAFEDDGQHYLVLEYIDGANLKDTIQQRTLDMSQIIDIALDIADALTRAHRLNIIHRDIKPANILIGQDGGVYLTDFGVAAFGELSNLTETDGVVGTIPYLSPEILEGRSVSEKSDIWAFGIVLYEMITDVRPFQGGHAGTLTRAILFDDVPDLEAITDGIPIALIDLIYRMLEKDPLFRIPSVRLVGVELEALKKGYVPYSPRQLGSNMQISGNASRFDTQDPYVVTKHNLPAQLTPFVGRDKELAEIDNLLGDPDVRLVTIVGPGGMGKTRLALEAAKTQLEHFANGVFLVELAPLDIPENIVSAIANAVNLHYYGRAEPKHQLLDYFRSKQLLLIMDNFEHLLEGAGLITDILRAAPHLKVLTTSREHLNLRGETVLGIDGLDFPDWETPEDALEFSAVKLFMQSAQRARPDFTLETKALKYVARICRLVEGLPLGILLAAAWIDMLTPEEIADEISQSLDFLVTEQRNIPARHRSIRAVFDSSWQRLTPVEKETFRMLSVFRGGFTRAAVQQVSEASLGTLNALVRQSLVRRNPGSGRYEIHELSREFAEEQLEAAGEVVGIKQAHCSYYAHFLHQRSAHIKSQQQLSALDEIEADFENVLAAWKWAVEQGNYDAIDLSLEALFLFSLYRWYGYFELLWSVSEHPPAQPGDAFIAWNRIQVRGLALQTFSMGEPADALARIERSLVFAKEQNDHAEIAFCLYALGVVKSETDNLTEATAYFENSLAYYRELGDNFYVSEVLYWIGTCYRFLGQHDHAFRFAREGLQMSQEIGNKIRAAFSKHNIGIIAFFRGNFSEAKQHLLECNTMHRETGHPIGISASSAALGALAFVDGNIDTARELANEALEIAVDRNYPYGKGVALAVLGLVANVEGSYRKSEQLCLESKSFAPSLRPMPLGADLGLAIAACGNGDLQAARRHNEALLKWGTAIHSTAVLTGCLPISAIILAQEGKQERAVQLLALAVDRFQSASGWMKKWPLLMRLREELRTELGDEPYTTAWDYGKTLHLETVGSETLAENGKKE